MGEKEQILPGVAAIAPSASILLRNYVSFVGIAIIAASLTSILLLFILEITGGEGNPYTVRVFIYCCPK